ncbi:MAG: hypothetical protein NWE88_01880 [Candidatus Bathyarchaeota archaeon]|nr:hypothetical protein [Candidatus Bathyarchaeota archaeon]
MSVLKAICSRCEIEYTVDEYQKDRFCKNCGAHLKLVTSPIVRKADFEGENDDRFMYDTILATSIGRVLHDQFQNKTGYFEGHVMPEYIPPSIDEGSRELALYYTFVIAVDYQTDAHKLWRNARRLYSQSPEYFEPENIINVSDDELKAFVRSLGARFPNNGAKAWKDISRILIRQYDGDPRNITREPLTSREVWRRLDKFPYIRGKKIGTLYLRVMGDLGLFKISDLDQLDVAVDVQVSRFTFYTGVLTPLEAMTGCVHNPPIKPAIERVWRQAAKSVGCAPWQLDMPMWVIASKQCTGKWCDPCPVNELCKQNFDASIQGNNLSYRP